jgi:hypothetical protein
MLVYKILPENLKGNYRHRLEYIIKTNLKEIMCNCVNLVHLIQDRI